MDAFQVPVSALITICLGLTVLALAISDSELWGEDLGQSIKHELIYTTEGERLVSRYVQGDDISYDTLVDDTRSYFGDSSSECLLNSVDRVMKQTSPGKLGRLYNLRGRILRDMGRENEAADYFRKSLMINRDDVEAQMELVKHYIKPNIFGLAQAQAGTTAKNDDQFNPMLPTAGKM